MSYVSGKNARRSPASGGAAEARALLGDGRAAAINLRNRFRRRPLGRLGTEAGLTEAAAGRDVLAGLEAAIGSRRPTTIVVITALQPQRLGTVFARRFPGARVDVLDSCAGSPAARQTHRRVRVHRTPNLHAAHRVLSRLAPVDLLIDLTVTGRTARLRHLLFHVADAGLLLIGNLVPEPSADDDVWRVLSRLLQAKVDLAGGRLHSWHDDDVARAHAILSASHDGRVVTVSKTGHHALKLHDLEAEEILRDRHGDGWGRSLDTREPLTFEARGVASANLLPHTFFSRLEVPRLHLREYRDVVCAPRQLAVQGDLVLPISFHHALRPRLLHRSPLLRTTGSHYALLDDSLHDATPLEGVYYYLDSEFPGHFGHVLTEDIAKLWGLDAARDQYPGLKILLSTVEPGGSPSAVQREVLRAWGIDDRDVVCIDAPVRVGTLLGATPMFYNGTYVHPELEQIWDRLRDALGSPPGSRAVTSPKVFVSRDPDELRRCTNGRELEAVFAEHGFAVVRPERLSIREQVDLFANAEVIAGYGGSGMFGALFSERPGRRIVIASENYIARNEWTISALKGDDYHHFVCPAELQVAPDPSRPHEKFHSPFRFDFERDGAALRALLAG